MEAPDRLEAYLTGELSRLTASVPESRTRSWAMCSAAECIARGILVAPERAMSFFDKLKTVFKSSQKLDVEARYELLREGVAGTMSDFYMARDRKSGEIVGLKINDEEKLNAFESRFKGLNKPTEGEIAVLLDHPNIVKTFQHGLTTKGRHYIVMEYLPGPGLNALINTQDPILEGRRLALIRQMAEALSYVHKSEIIHRDICPRNFICSKEVNSLKLIDFGLSLPAKKNFMQPGNRTGTPMYMAPEIIRRRWTDHRVDIFSMGVSAYQLCCFRFPWPVGDNPALSAMSHDTSEPINILKHRSDLHPVLADAIMRCLAAEPRNRPPTVADFLKQIRDLSSETAG
jgi:serine/threonine-protein kinase